MSILERMLNMLTGAYNRDDVKRAHNGLPPVTNIGKIFAIYAEGFDIIQENAQRVQDWNDLDQAQGATLDRYGKNVGVYRQGSTDQFYRLLIKVKRMSQLSGGDLNTVTNAACILLDVTEEDLRIVEVFPAKIYVQVDQNALSDEMHQMALVIVRMLKRLIAAGVGIRLMIMRYIKIENGMYLNQAAIATPRIIAGPPIERHEVVNAAYALSAAIVTTRIRA